MDYQSLYYQIKALMKAGGGKDETLGICLKKYPFTSPGAQILPGKDHYYCPRHERLFDETKTADILAKEATEHHYNLHPLKMKDSTIEENKYFDYFILHPLEKTSDGLNKGVILLFHGLNEKSWDKYLPWAVRLVQLTGKSVVLFPIAFHMNRAHKSWSDIKSMHEIALIRQQNHPGFSNISAVNTAISIRLGNQPDRLFWSGLQTYQDISQFIKKIKKGQIEGIDPEASIDFFAYSIGAFFSLILLMANPYGYFSHTKLFAFCGGTTLDRSFPISKYILDSNAGQTLNSYFSEQLHNHFQGSERLAHYMDHHEGENVFKLMLHYNLYKELREAKMATIQNQVMAVPLKKDTIIPPVEVLSTLKGDYRDIPTRVEPMDFDYPYDHVHPFSLMEKYRSKTGKAFEELMHKAADFLERGEHASPFNA
jgi:hypothetical protein